MGLSDIAIEVAALLSKEINGMHGAGERSRGNGQERPCSFCPSFETSCEGIKIPRKREISRTHSIAQKNGAPKAESRL